MVISAAEALRIQSTQESPEHLAAEMLNEQIDKTIRICSQQGMQRANVVIPGWLLGLPVYDKEVVKEEVMGVFRKAGFRVTPDDKGFRLDWGKRGEEAAPVVADSVEPPSSKPTGSVRLISVKAKNT